MICPNCGAEQPESFECSQCGIVFARWEEHQARIREGRVPTRSGWTRPLGTTGRFGRLAAGFTCIGLAILLFLSGRALQAVGPFLAVAFFAAAGLYFLVSVRGRIPAWRFGVESLVLAGVSAVFVLVLPDVFSLGHPMYRSTVTPRPPSPVRRVVDAARARVAGIRNFLSVQEISDTARAVELSREIEEDPIEAPYQALVETDRVLAYPTYARLAALRPLLDTLNRRLPRELPKGPGAWVPAAVIQDVLAALEAAERDIANLERALDVQEGGPGPAPEAP